MGTLRTALVGQTGILSIKKNGEQVSRYRPDLGDAEIDISSSEKTTTTGKFSTINGGKLESCIVDLEPIQDLHGYNHPWVGGSGKNLIPMTVDAIKSTNSAGTWSGNTYSLRGCEVTINTDDDGNIISFTVNRVNTNTSNLVFYLVRDLVIAQESILNGCPSGGSDTTYRIRTGDNDYDYGSGVTVQPKTTGIYIRVEASYDIQNVTFYPMLRKATVTDATFEPYTNICSIEGYPEVEVLNRGFNLWDEQWETGQYDQSTGQKINPTGVTTKRSVNYIKVDPSTTYFLHTNVNVRLFRYTADKTYIATVVVNKDTEFTTSSTTGYITFQCDASMTYICINVSDENVNGTYEPYKGQDIIVNLGGTYYGGSHDVVSGVLTVTKKYYDMGSLTWGKYTDSSNRVAFYTQSLTDITEENEEGAPPDFIMSCYKGVNSITRTNFMNNGADFTAVHIKTNKTIFIKDSTYTSEIDFATAVTGQQIVYELATPLVIQLTPQQINTLIGENHLDVPLTGQSLTSAVYRELFAWDDAKQICKQFYGTCDSAADVQNKVVTISADQNFKLTTGCVIYVKFTNTNSASSPTLNVNGSGDKSLMYSDTAPYTGNSGLVCGLANYIHQYIYDGTYWVWQGYSYEKDTTYSKMSEAEMRTGTSTSARAVTADTLKKITEERIDAKTGKWLEQTATLSTSADTTYTFTDSDITADSMVEVWCEIDGFDYSSITVASGSVTVVYPKYTSAVSMKCRINVKNITV